MENYVKKVAIVTGASSGIGAGLSRELAKKGCIVVGLARRMDKLKALSDDIKQHPEIYKGEFHPLQCDVSNENQLKEAFSQIKTDYGIPWILINNAGIAKFKSLTELDGETFDEVINTNVKALVLATSYTLKLMVENSVPGHILNINSIVGHYLLISSRNTLYSISKHMARVFAQSIREITSIKKGNIKISNICPGLTHTALAEKSSKLIKSLSKSLTVDDVVKACMVILDTPPNVLISELIMMHVHQDTTQLLQKL